MLYLLATLPILLLVGLLTVMRWSIAKAGAASYSLAVLIAFLAFGSTPLILLISQSRGLLLSLYILGVIWPALLLFNAINNIGGIDALAKGLESSVGNRGLLLVAIAWAFSGLLEGIAGFGIPIAVVAPILVSLGVQPLLAVAAAAVGHAWAVSFGSMGILFQTLASILQIDTAIIMPATVLLLSIGCLGCGLASAWILKQLHVWPFILIITLIMSVVLYALATSNMVPLAGFGAGTAGLLSAMALTGKGPVQDTSRTESTRLYAALGGYGAAVLLLVIIFLPTPLRDFLAEIGWHPVFPATVTSTGWATASLPGQAILPFIHPGMMLFLAAIACLIAFNSRKLMPSASTIHVFKSTFQSALSPSLGIIFTIGLSSLMEYTGMTHLLARGLADLFGATFPLISPLIGVLGAFSTGSNNASNVLFAPLQRSTAELIGADARIVLAQQTAGGSIGSMIAPAKVSVGCATASIPNQEGLVIRKTLPIGIGLAVLLGLVGLLILAI